MPRGLSNAFKAAIGGSIVYPSLFVEFDFDSGAQRFWTGESSIAWDGKNWFGGGLLGEMRTAGESQQIEAKQLQFVLNGVDTAYYSVAVNTPYRGRPVRIWFNLIDPGTETVEHSTLLETARMDVMSINQNEEAITLIVECERRIVDMFSPNVIYSTPSDYARIEPQSQFYRYVPKLQDMRLPWGLKVIRRRGTSIDEHEIARLP